MSIYVLNTIFFILFIYTFYHPFSNTNVILFCQLDSNVIRSWFYRYYEYKLPSFIRRLPTASILFDEQRNNDAAAIITRIIVD